MITKIMIYFLATFVILTSFSMQDSFSEEENKPEVSSQAPENWSSGYTNLKSLDSWILRDKSDGGSGPLKEGQESVSVVHLQKALVTLDYDLGKFGPKQDGVDGKFGEVTKNAVKQFQTNNIDFQDKRLEVNGIVGPLTADAINRELIGKWYSSYQTPSKIIDAYELEDKVPRKPSFNWNIIFIIVIVIAAGIGGFVFYMKQKKKKEQNHNDITHSVNQDVSVEKYLICSNCNTKNKDDVQFCQQCGHDLGKTGMMK